MTIALERPVSTHAQSLARGIHSEWIKVRTLRSTWIGLATVVVIMIGFGALAAAMATGSVTDPGGDGGPPFAGAGPLGTALSGANLAVLLVGVLGSLAGAREYGSRMITATVTTMPRRWQVIVAKSAALAAVMIPTAVIAVMGAYGVAMGILGANGNATVALTDDGVLSSLLGMVGYLVAVAVLGLCLGSLLRSVAGSIGTVVGGLLIVPALASALLPDSWDKVLQLLPSSAAASFTEVGMAGGSTLSAGAGAAVLIGWVVALMAGAVVAIHRRDV
ncbi:ABC transporter permease [Kribbella antibiotica]|uniref:ABC transporter permease n=1 Tax=Kribbella antibiotica TaxID=190195 RepID=A0A4V2YPX8_9ACTN|nr:ABC transporter permease [Kribbella antibiotica]TDD59967.1 ABC transporter permease [Kribbella antibiotica]